MIMRLLFLLSLLLAHQQPLAAIIGVNFSGTIYQADDMSSDEYRDPTQDWIIELESRFDVGGRIHGSYYYDSEVLPYWANTNSEGTENLFPLISMEIYMEGFSARAEGGISIIDGYYGGIDQYVLWADVDDNISSQGTIAPLFAMGLGIYDYSGTLYHDADQLPLTVPDLSIYDDRQISMLFMDDLVPPYEGSFYIGASLDALEIITVPEPSITAVFLLGLLMLASRNSSQSTRD